MELFNVTSRKWSQLEPMPIGRGLHACGLYQGGVVAAGGWTETEDGWNEISHTAVWYDPSSATWTQLNNLKKGRTQFALEEVNGTMTAIGGFDVSVFKCCDTGPYIIYSRGYTRNPLNNSGPTEVTR